MVQRSSLSPWVKFLLPLLALALLVGCKGEETRVEEKQGMRERKIAYDGKILEGAYEVLLHTSKGDITLKLNADKAPKTVTNFVMLSKVGYYDGLTFHRVIPNFMIQGGDPNGDGTGGESIFGSTFEDEKNEIPLERGVIAMANRGPNTNGSQFFIIHATDGTPWLQGKHTAFGRVTEGIEVVDAIAAVPRGERDNPLEPITFTVEVRE